VSESPYPWRDHPRLKGRFHEEHPDDIQVIVHEGGPRLGGGVPEIAWVRVSGGAGDTFTGTLLNQPEGLASLPLGSVVRFTVPMSGEFPLMVTEKYLAERADWIIHPCDECGLTELFDAPSDLLAAAFPRVDQTGMELFTSRCVACGGPLVIQRVGAEPIERPVVEKSTRWWKFWE
jgi:hypothetical protein